jgi:multidrug efflux pump subunit AcrB
MRRPLGGSSLATIAVFVPLAFLGGVAGAFFKALALTMVSSLVISYAFGLLIVPLLARALWSERDAKHEDVGSRLGWLLDHYERVVRAILRRPIWAAVGLVPLLGLGCFSYLHVGSGFFPAMDEGGFVIDYRAPAGTSLAETDRRLRQLEAILGKTPEVLSYSRRTGLQLGGAITEANEGDYFVRLKPLPRRPIDEVMDEVRQGIEERVPGLETELPQLMEDLIGDLTAVPQPIEVKIFGPDPEQLRVFATSAAERIGHIPGVVDVKSGVVLAGDAQTIRVDRVKAKLLDLDPDQVTQLASVALGGNVTTQVQRGEKMVGIRVWGAPAVRKTREAIELLPLRSAGGTRVRLGRVASFQAELGQPQITRENLKTMVAVTGRISGRDMGSVMRDVQRKVAAQRLPSGAYVAYGGLYQIQQQSFRGLLLVLVAAAVLVFSVLLYLYEDFVAPTAIMIVAGLAAVAVFPALWLSGIELNITSMVGLSMIVGVSAEAGIFYMSQVHESARERPLREALTHAGRVRLRPIVMTALAAIFALLPLAIGVGQGSAMLKPLAVAIIGGLVVTVPAVLFLLPVIVRLLAGKEASWVKA